MLSRERVCLWLFNICLTYGHFVFFIKYLLLLQKGILSFFPSRFRSVWLPEGALKREKFQIIAINSNLSNVKG